MKNNKKANNKKILNQIILIVSLLMFSGCTTIRPYTGNSSNSDDHQENAKGVLIKIPW